MRISPFLRNNRAGTILCLLAAAAAGAWWGHDSILAWYYVQGLSRATDDEREAWVERVVGADSAAVPGLVRCLECQDSQVCRNSQAALVRLWALWPADDFRRSDFLTRLGDAFGRLSLSGQHTVLRLQNDWLESAPAADLIACGLRVLPLAGRSLDRDVRSAAMTLAGAILQCDRRPDSVAACQETIRQGFQDAETENRLLAVRLAVRAEVHLLPQVAPLLDDASAAVRQAALLALGPAGDAITTDDLLRSLHDTDADVRRLCEATLRGRGLRTQDLALGRLISDPQPSVRLRVFETLQRANDLEPGVWLKRMSHDPVAAVRAAAIRAATEQAHLDLTDRLQQMAQNDPSSTVRQLAAFYLTRQKKLQLSPSEP